MTDLNCEVLDINQSLDDKVTSNCIRKVLKLYLK